MMEPSYAQKGGQICCPHAVQKQTASTNDKLVYKWDNCPKGEEEITIQKGVK